MRLSWGPGFAVLFLLPLPTRAASGDPSVNSSCWNDAWVTQRYSPDPANAPNQASDCKIPGQQNIDDLADPMNAAAMQALADKCKSLHPGDTYAEIRCAATAADVWVDQSQCYGGGNCGPLPINGPGALRTRCRDHERAFRQIMSDMNLPGVSVGVTCVYGTIYDPVYQANFSGHILNTVTVTGADGKQYTYMVDVGYDPGMLTPKDGDPSCSYAKDHPDSPLPGQQAPAPPSFLGVTLPPWLSFLGGTERPGANVKRDAATRPATSGAASPEGEPAGTTR